MEPHFNLINIQSAKSFIFALSGVCKWWQKLYLKKKPPKPKPVYKPPPPIYKAPEPVVVKAPPINADQRMSIMEQKLKGLRRTEA